jgi:hypothetical protein
MVLAWLLGAAVGPAAVALPMTWGADALADAARRWFRRLSRTDDLSRLVRAATGTSVDLSRVEFAAVRRLLEDQQTWSVDARGTVENLATRIASCLPPGDSRTAAESHAAALSIARGLLEFAVADLEPKLFQQLLVARLQRMETDQASALDKALLAIHVDLAARFAGVMGQFKQVLDRLPPGPAGRGEIVVYLRALIDWMNTDPWPRDQRFGGPVLTPAAIERKLKVTVAGRHSGQVLDADDLVRQCQQLVILGGPGSGKTWLAKRTARRCAEAAIEALAAGGMVDEVELPLYTTCSRLFTVGGDIREAAVSSALAQLGDLGGSRVTAALRTFFAERNAPTVLVIDALDEAHGNDERLRQAGTLPWRIVLTSRPGSWNHQLILEEGNDSHRVGEIQSLRYPADVVPFIDCWFAQRPEWGRDLAAQIAQRPDLRQAATVPLILAWYCIVGGSQPLPAFRRDLYSRVLKRMLTGRWRGSDDRRPGVGTCLRTLRDWAWRGAPHGAASDPVSGVGTWMDDIPTEGGSLAEADEDAVDHVAMPIGPPDIDTGMTLRRFVHRAIREHLVAEHVASLPVDEAADVLLPHLWYDSDWEYSGPAALAMHPHRDQLLRGLICRATGSGQIPGDLSVIDARWEFRRFLVRVAAESREADWSPQIAGIIGQARVELAHAGRMGDLGTTVPWETSGRQARDVLLGLLAGQTNDLAAARLMDGVARLASTAEDKQQARAALLGLLGGHTTGSVAALLTAGLARLDPTPQEKRQACEAVLGLLARETNRWTAAELAGGVARLDPTAKDMRQARKALLRLLAGQTGYLPAERLVGGVARLAPTAEDMRQARKALLRLLARATDEAVAGRLAAAVTGLASTAEGKRQVRDTLLRLLGDHTNASVAVSLAADVARLDPTPEEKRKTRDTLLGLLARETDSLTAELLADEVARLASTAEEKREARDTILGCLGGHTDGYSAVRLAGELARLDPTVEDERQARDSLLGLLAREINSLTAEHLAGEVARLASTAEDKRQARHALLRLLAAEHYGEVAAHMAGEVARLDPTAEDRCQARDALLGLLPSQAGYWAGGQLVSGVARLASTAEEKRQARDALLGLLARETGRSMHQIADNLLDGMAQLAPTVRDLSNWRAWTVLPTAELLAAVRWNSALVDWLAALPSLTSLSTGAA